MDMYEILRMSDFSFEKEEGELRMYMQKRPTFRLKFEARGNKILMYPIKYMFPEAINYN